MRRPDQSLQGTALAVHGLSIDLVGGAGIVENVNFVLSAGGSLGIVGESGSGKTTLAMALVGHAGPGIGIAGGRIEIAGRDILTAGRKELAALRGREIAHVPQDAPSALNPSMRAGEIVAEMLRIHAPERYGPESIASAMGLVDLPADAAFLRRYPHQLSGGQQQRLAIAAAMAAEPRVLVLDEPTTGLDMITQNRILDEVGRLRAHRCRGGGDQPRPRGRGAALRHHGRALCRAGGGAGADGGLAEGARASLYARVDRRRGAAGRSAAQHAWQRPASRPPQGGLSFRPALSAGA